MDSLRGCRPSPLPRRASLTHSQPDRVAGKSVWQTSILGKRSSINASADTLMALAPSIAGVRYGTRGRPGKESPYRCLIPSCFCWGELPPSPCLNGSLSQRPGVLDRDWYSCSFANVAALSAALCSSLDSVGSPRLPGDHARRRRSTRPNPRRRHVGEGHRCSYWGRPHGHVPSSIRDGTGGRHALAMKPCGECPAWEVPREHSSCPEFAGCLLGTRTRVRL